MRSPLVTTQLLQQARTALDTKAGERPPRASRARRVRALAPRIRATG
jgi:hypothetical protein